MKINDHEAARLCGTVRAPEELVLREEALASARALYARFGKPVFVTRGSRGLVVVDQAGLCEVPGIQVLGQVDTVGAGDSALAGISLALAAGCDPVEAAQFGNFVAGVTIQKLNQTGTASPAEILTIGREQAYVYHPELAEDPRRARHLPGTEFEVVRDVPAGFAVTHAIFDHDGTISTLRQGWHLVMEPMMVRAILGPRYQSADEALYRRVVEAARKFIDDSTGIQTLVQMQGLVDMVREFGCVPETEILDPPGYKAIYNEALMRLVRERLAKLRRKELAVEDFVVKNAVLLLERLHAAGVRLYLASGTDQQDVDRRGGGPGLCPPVRRRHFRIRGGRQGRGQAGRPGPHPDRDRQPAWCARWPPSATARWRSGRRTSGAGWPSGSPATKSAVTASTPRNGRAWSGLAPTSSSPISRSSTRC